MNISTDSHDKVKYDVQCTKDHTRFNIETIKKEIGKEVEDVAEAEVLS